VSCRKKLARQEPAELEIEVARSFGSSRRDTVAQYQQYQVLATETQNTESAAIGAAPKNLKIPTVWSI